VLLAPFNLCSVVLAYIAAVVIDATGNYRLIWLFPAATGLAHATVNCWLKYPARTASSPDMVGRLWKWSVVQAESMADAGIVAGLLAAPLLGVVTKEDADSAVVIDMARNILGNPYEDLEGPVEGAPGTPDKELAPDPADQSGAVPRGDAGGEPGVTGVRQVGGGPLDDLAMGDQKSGWVDSPSARGDGPARSDGSDGTPPPGPSGSGAGTDGTETDPDGGVASVEGSGGAGSGEGAGGGDSQSNRPAPATGSPAPDSGPTSPTDVDPRDTGAGTE
jgi:hypothetical protein